MDIDKYTDQQIVEALLARDPGVTRQYLYRKCFPLFYSIFSRYYTDCTDVIEFINEIYVDILMPGVTSGHCKLETFSYKCTLTMWLKIVAENHCRSLFAKKPEFDTQIESGCDRIAPEDESFEVNIRALDMHDAKKILDSMPNYRYRMLIQHKYLEEKTHEETAALLGMTLDNYYNKHRLAKAQLCKALKNEGLI